MDLYPPPETLSPNQLVQVLRELKALLETLPADLPQKADSESRYSQFHNFRLDPDIFETTGCEISTLSEHLKGVFGFTTRSTGDGIVDIDERGPLVLELHTVLVHFYQEHPANNVLRKWIVDIANGARKAHFVHHSRIPPPLDDSQAENVTGPSVSSKDSMSMGESGGSAQKRGRSDTLAMMIPQSKSAKSHEKSKPSQAQAPTLQRTGSGAGRKRNELLYRLAIPGEDAKGKQNWTCIAPLCEHSGAGNMDRSRILKHAVKCPKLADFDADAKREALSASVQSSLGHQVQQQEEILDAASSSSAPKPITSKSTTVSGSESGIHKHVMSDGTLNLKPLQKAGREQKAKAVADFKRKVDHGILKLICVCGLVPAILDRQEWKDFVGLLNGTYEPSSSSMFRDTYIPQEGAYVRSEMERLLSQEEDLLTLTFDGTTIRALISFYTAHATTSDRRSFLLDGHEGSGEHHNRDWIVAKLLKTIDKIGASRWAASVSDNTNVTKAARQGVTDEYPHILPIWDCVHHIQNTIKDITNLAHFKPVMSTMKSIVKYFSKSSFGVAKLLEQRHIEASKNMEKILRLQKPSLNAIRSLTQANIISFKNTRVQSLFANRTSDKYAKFEMGLLQYTEVVAPLIRSLWSLEAAHANASDVLVFWVAMAATLKDLFSRGPERTGIPRLLSNEIVGVYNKRYTEFFRNELYFVTFLLDPRYPKEKFLKDPPQNSRLSVVIPSQQDRQSGIRPKVIKYQHAFQRFSDYCRDTLIDMLKHVRDAPADASLGYLSCLRDECPRECANALKVQLEMFWNNDFPFDAPDLTRDAEINPLEWWKDRRHNKNAKMLALVAIKLFAILINSMPDERTNSMLTWLNSPIRGNQSASTLVDMIQIGQWYGTHMKTDAPPSRYRPAVKYSKINAEILARLQNGVLSTTDKNAAPSDIPAGDDIRSEAGNILDLSDDEADDDFEASSTSDDDREEAEDFKIDIDIDINSTALLDMIAEKVVSTSGPEAARVAQPQPRPAKQLYTVEEAFDDW